MPGNSDFLYALSKRFRASQGVGEERVVLPPVPPLRNPVTTERVVPPPGPESSVEALEPPKRTRRTKEQMAAARDLEVPAKPAAAVEDSPDGASTE